MIDFKKDLNLEQQRVVFEGNGSCLVLAGAGSGKTRTITYRVAYLLEQGVKPENILLVTFTNKAAREMIERVEKLTPKSPLPPFNKGGKDPIGSGGILLPWSGTFHHISYRMLKKYAELIGYKNNFSVLDSEDSLDLIKLCLKDEGIDRKEKRFPSPGVIQSIISYARNSETTIEDTLDLKHPHFLPVSETIVRIYDNYQKKKLIANVMDFDDLLVNWYLLLLKNSSVKNRYAEQFKYILVDEYQDTNKIQASIIDLLASKHQNLLVVGDDAQSIYSFRAADIQNILAFEKKYSNTKIFKLETNYRSTPDILNLANNIIANNLKQYEKKLTSLQKSFTKPELHVFADQAEEAEFITARIEELLGEGVFHDKIAVLFRAAYHSQALEMELVKRGIDYDYRGGTRFFERAHIKDVLAYLRIINNIEDVVAWRRVLNMQIGIGPVMAERVISQIRTTGEIENIGSQLSAKAQIGWNDFLQIYQKLISLPLQGGGEEGVSEGTNPTLPSPHRGGNPSDLIAEILDSKYIEYLENEFPDYRERTQDIEQLAVFAKKQPDLNTFLAEATLQENFRSAESSNNNEKIILSTIHQAKGLEWEAVFVLGLSSGQFPIDKALRERDGLEEERRLFYVAVTRAKKHLYLTYSLTAGFGDFLSGPSMFLEELDVDLVDQPHRLAGKNDSGGGSVFQDEVEYISEDEEFEKNIKRTGFLKSIEEL